MLKQLRSIALIEIDKPSKPWNNRPWITNAGSANAVIWPWIILSFTITPNTTFSSHFLYRYLDTQGHAYEPLLSEREWDPGGCPRFATRSRPLHLGQATFPRDQGATGRAASL